MIDSSLQTFLDQQPIDPPSAGRPMRTPGADGSPPTTTPTRGRASAVELDAVTKVYGADDNHVVALDNVSVALPAGSFTAVMGPSGSGKSTFLHCAAGLDQPTEGTVTIDGTPVTGRSETELTKFRRERVGFVFQHFNLLPTLTVFQNVALPQRLAGRRVDKRRCRDVLDRIGLGDRLDHRPSELSGGQQQRVAIARAVAADPSVIFADEPTGALDTRSAAEILTLLREAVHQLGQTIVMVTHDPVAASAADSVVFLADGRIVGQLLDPTPAAVAERMAHLGDRVGVGSHPPAPPPTLSVLSSEVRS